jgi:hypothetical protein
MTPPKEEKYNASVPDSFDGIPGKTKTLLLTTLYLFYG